MFDVGFSEIVLILVVALVVIGPEKLPKVARTLGLLAGRMQRYAASVKADVERELRNEEVLRLEREAQNTIASLKSSINEEVQHIEQAASLTDGQDEKTDKAPFDSRCSGGCCHLSLLVSIFQ
jgi:sec-independent protein translocase protein TatB